MLKSAGFQERYVQLANMFLMLSQPAQVRGCNTPRRVAFLSLCGPYFPLSLGRGFLSSDGICHVIWQQDQPRQYLTLYKRIHLRD